MKSLSQNVSAALNNAFNSTAVQGLSADEYSQFVHMCAALTINTLIKNEGLLNVKEFIEAALNDQGPYTLAPILRQVKVN